MAILPNRPCRQSHCKNMQPCPIHPIDTNKRSGIVNKCYLSPTWRKFRIIFLTNNPVCADCNGIATLIHHIIPIDKGGELLDPDNCMPMCHRCHEIRHERIKKD